MPREVRMPSLGQTTDELRIVAWLKAEGDAVRLGEPLLEVETDKATVEVESVASGSLLKVVRGTGELVPAGALIAYIGQPGEVVGEERSDGPAQHPAPTGVGAPEKVLATPLARQLARQHGIDLARVRGTGPQGRIEKEDVLALATGAEHAVPAAEPLPPAETPVPKHRQVIAQRLMHSVRTIPQITLTVTVDMSRARAALTSQREAGLTGLTYTHLILRAVAGALRAHPEMRRLWTDGPTGPHYRHIDRADVGLAVAGEDTLVVVTIPEPDQASVEQLIRATGDAVQRGRAGTLAAADMEPAAITVSNLGMYRVDRFQGIIDPAQTAILTTGRIADQVAAIDGGIRIVPRMQISLSVDHRVADGVVAARFLGSVAERLEAGEV
jgi:pyruvate dehydrogenase E2 component (dihydrolipoamide acetyltransferase)